MRHPISGLTQLVVGDYVASVVEIGRGATERETTVTLSLDGIYDWTFPTPSWRSLSFGFGHGVVYLWSARSVVVLPHRPSDTPVVMDVDEDLQYVYARSTGWLLVCETSIRLLRGTVEVDRVEAGEVIERVRWESGVLTVEDQAGKSIPITVEGDRLHVSGEFH